MAENFTFGRTEEQSMLSGTVREILETNSNLDQVRQMSLTTDAFDRGVWQKLSEMGVIGLHVPEEYGGAGYGFEEMAVVFEELGRMVTPVPLLSSLVASTAILMAASDSQKSVLLPSIASGETIATLAVFEQAHGNFRDTTKTSAKPAGETWVINGTKRFVTDAPNADLFVVVALVGDEVGVFVVDSGADGVAVTSDSSLDGTRPLGSVEFVDVEIPAESYLGGAVNPDAVQAALDAAVVAMAQEQVGGAQRCLEMSVDYAKTRYQFGRAIGSFQAIKHMCADMLVAVEQARSVAWHAARTLEDAEESKISVPLAKSVCSDAYLKAAGDNIQIHGGIGFTWEHDAHLYFKRAKSTSLLFGSVGSHRDRLGDAIGI
ncbi:MAG: acyl-CoA dehydrogenase family protein [Acidimicrobiia bacterium]|nr:MAG: acyl-CoA dehydrogenase family protein [Acidimicrobiia bacterium]